MSPELIAPEKFGFKTSRPTRSSDCYSLGMVAYEAFSGNIPFHETPDLAVFLKVVEGKHPTRVVGFIDGLWEMMEQCWMSHPDRRPNVEGVLEYFEMCSTGENLGSDSLTSTPAVNPDNPHVWAPLVNTFQDTLPEKSQIDLEFSTAPDLTGRGFTWKTLRPTSQYRVRQQTLRAQNRDQPQPPPINRLMNGMPPRQAIRIPPNDGGLPNGMPGGQNIPNGHIDFPVATSAASPPAIVNTDEHIQRMSGGKSRCIWNDANANECGFQSSSSLVKRHVRTVHLKIRYVVCCLS